MPQWKVTPLVCHGRWCTRSSASRGQTRARQSVASFRGVMNPSGHPVVESVQNDDQKRGQWPEEERYKPPVQPAAPLGLRQAGIDQ